MSEIVKNDKNFKVIEVDFHDLLWVYGNADCANCANCGTYYVAVLNCVLCEKCYENWLREAKYNPEDREIEERNFRWMESHILLQ